MKNYILLSGITAAVFSISACKKSESSRIDELQKTIALHEENMKVLNQQMSDLNQRFQRLANATEEHRTRILELEKKNPNRGLRK